MRRLCCAANRKLACHMFASATLYGHAPVRDRCWTYLKLLNSPQASDLTRKRKIDSNPPVGQKRPRGQGSSEPKSVSAKDRVNEFPDECLPLLLEAENYFVVPVGKS